MLPSLGFLLSLLLKFLNFVIFAFFFLIVVFYFTDFTDVTGTLLYKCYQVKVQLNRPHWLLGWKGGKLEFGCNIYISRNRGSLSTLTAGGSSKCPGLSRRLLFIVSLPKLNCGIIYSIYYCIKVDSLKWPYLSFYKELSERFSLAESWNAGLSL